MSEQKEAPEQIDSVFLQHVTRATTSYSEGWRDVCARLQWAEAQLTAHEAEIARLREEVEQRVDLSKVPGAEEYDDADGLLKGFIDENERQRRRAEAAEASLSALREILTRVEQEMREEYPIAKFRGAPASLVLKWADLLHGAIAAQPQQPQQPPQESQS